MAFTFNNDYSAHASDEISLFLRQLLHRSSSSSPSPAAQSSSLPHSSEINVGFPPSSAAMPDAVVYLPAQSVMTISDLDRPVVDRASAASETCGYTNGGLSTYWSEIPTAVSSNLTSSSAAPVDSDSPTAGSVHLRSTENEADDYDFESEEGLEEAQPKQNQLRNSSKRSRAAEVHNMSEKTDKASMLDEAIEYLKQLQLQVQMLSMRNGLILHPKCLPGFPGVLDPVLMSQMGLNFSNIDESSQPNIGDTLPYGPFHQCDPLTKPHLDRLSGTVTEASSFSLHSSMENQVGSFHLPTSSQSICRDDTIAQQHQLSITNSQTNALLESLAPMSSSDSKYNSQSSYLKDDAQEVLLTNCTRTTAPDDI
ncbi:hypothetical protein V2J09_016396 [Rumex salicifolius]